MKLKDLVTTLQDMIMALKFFFITILCAFSVTPAWAADSQPIPELPAAEEKTAAPEEKLSLVEYQEPVSNFFDDNIYNQGPSRFLNVLSLAGCFRTNFRYWHNPHLQTFVPELGQGTSLMRPDLSIFNDRTDDGNDTSEQPGQNQFSGLMRLRVEPTINVSETVRIRTTVDVFDNMVLGSTPSYLLRGPSFMSPSQTVNSLGSAINLKRAWAEASFAIGDLRFGRMPFHWGLGIIHNSGDDINNDYGDQVDGIFFSTRINDHFLTPGYSIAYAGPIGRSAGILSSQHYVANYLPHEPGPRYPLESGDLTHVLSLSLLKRDSDFITSKKTEEGRAVFNYGLLASYRHQSLDSQAVLAKSDDGLKELADRIVKRDGNVGLMSLWTELVYGTLHIELEAAGVWGKYSVGEKPVDALAPGAVEKKSIWLLRGGLALESRYGFLNDRLQIGLNGGIASSESGLGFGIRDESKNTERSFKTHFLFNPAYSVDMILHREVLGGIGGTAYIKPHISYFFSRNFGVRGDVITAIAPDKSNTTGGSNWLGVELDANTFLRTESGFYFQLGYGVLFPLYGLDNKLSSLTDTQKKRYGNAKIAQTVQAFFGVSF